LSDVYLVSVSAWTRVNDTQSLDCNLLVRVDTLVYLRETSHEYRCKACAQANVIEVELMRQLVRNRTQLYEEVNGKRAAAVVKWSEVKPLLMRERFD
jgi:hypothetical protein